MTKVVWLPNETDYSYCEVLLIQFQINDKLLCDLMLLLLKVIVRVQGFIVVWPNHWRRPELAGASSPVIWPYHN